MVSIAGFAYRLAGVVADDPHGDPAEICSKIGNKYIERIRKRKRG
jgi:hypothetical protein